MTTLPNIVRCSSFAAFHLFVGSDAILRSKINAFETGLLSNAESFTVPGRCAICRKDVAFLVDYEWGNMGLDGRRRPNWRERLVCPSCHLNNRMRAALAFLLAGSKWLDKIYLTEAATQLFWIASRRRPRATGSEYLCGRTESGANNARGTRHEDVTRLPFADRSFHQIGAFDVLEHIPNYREALAEFFRCLRPSGKLLITAPVVLGSPTTITRSASEPNGSVKHVLAPEIHGDPLAGEKVYHFGWDLLERLREVGFRDEGLSFYWSPELGYLGGYQFVITARRPPAASCDNVSTIRDSRFAAGETGTSKRDVSGDQEEY